MPSNAREPKFIAPFGANAMRLGWRHWGYVAGLVGLLIWLTPWGWEKMERFETGTDYRIPYDLSKDYWLYARRLWEARDPAAVFVVGDSVVWGEYVTTDGTLSHFLDQASGMTNGFINAGVNGLFPLALEGLITHYGGALRDRRVMLHCNLLWMSSPKADLQVRKEEKFNHHRLVPQFVPSIPCYKAEANERISIVVERSIPFLGWVQHLQNAYFDQKGISDWTLATDDSDPPQYLNSYRCPLSQITMTVPVEPRPDPLRGVESPRHKPWSTKGRGSTRFDWVELQTSMQWAAFRRLTQTLRDRGNRLLVVIGPFNEHFMAEENRIDFQRLRDGVAEWLEEQGIPGMVPEVLPSELYADASHPLTGGYEILANTLWADPVFQKWYEGSQP